MDESYKKLFIEIDRSAQVLTERVMDYDKSKNDEQGYKTAESMRDDYIKVEDLLKNDKALEYNDYVKLLAASYMIANNLQDQITTLQKVVDAYKTITIPQLSRIMDEGKDNPEKFEQLVEELFKNPDANI